ncbi:MAG TPA: TauD/TfdA family dioxygenase [Pyrinomonadaceae bacterium]|jgi:alpha-ketoglutarate-dependent taurine dioxygenase
MLKASVLHEKGLPLLIEADELGETGFGHEALIRLCLDYADSLRARLSQAGALLLRGFPVLTAPEFAQFVRWFSGRELLDYVGGASPRIKLCGRVYTSTEYPGHYALSLHNELSYTYRWPRHLFFCCVKPPAQGGETPLADSRALLQSIGREVTDEFKSKRIRYDRNLSGVSGSGYSWQDAFETGDKARVENYCREGGVKFRWRADGGLWLSEIHPATRRHPLTGEEVWFNQADAFHPSVMAGTESDSLVPSEDLRLNAFFGDGTPLDPSTLDHIREVMRQEAVLVSWQAGDILILDNMLTAHGRMPFTGPRKILLAMTWPYSDLQSTEQAQSAGVEAGLEAGTGMRLLNSSVK